MIPLLILVVALAIATVWFVALPAFDTAPAKRACEIVVRKSGAPECVRQPTRASQAAPRKSDAAKH